MRNLESLGATVGAALKSRGETIAVSESSTGGLIAASLLAVPGASAYFLGGAVVYTAASRGAWLGLPGRLPEAVRSSSQPYAALCAAVARERLGATWSIAETGAAGPSGNRYGDAPGHTCIAVDGPRCAVQTLETGAADREANMWAFTGAALEMLARVLEQR